MRIILLHANKKVASGADFGDIMKGEAQTNISGLTEEERATKKPTFVTLLRLVGCHPTDVGGWNTRMALGDSCMLTRFNCNF